MKKTLHVFHFLFLSILTTFGPSQSLASDGYERGGPFSSYTQESEIYLKQVQPILDRRCTVCHSCFEAACQLKLTSSEMLMRGANSHSTNGGLVFAAPRTDLMITPEQQKAGGFYSVTDGNTNSILTTLLLAGNDKSNLPTEKYVGPEKRQCVSSIEKYKSLDFGNQKKAWACPTIWLHSTKMNCKRLCNGQVVVPRPPAQTLLIN